LARACTFTISEREKERREGGEERREEIYRCTQPNTASLTDEKGMKTMLAESTIKGEGLEKGAGEPTSQTV